MQIIAVYTDGGVIGVNPSPIGGTWAWCLVNAENQRVRWDSGVVTPADIGMPTVSNNLTELLALVNALEALPHRSPVHIYSDSYVSLQRVFLAAALKNVPASLITRLQTMQRSRHLERMQWTLLDGHPTRAQLAAGRGKRGNLVSAHNVWCDQECTRRAAGVQHAPAIG